MELNKYSETTLKCLENFEKGDSIQKTWAKSAKEVFITKSAQEKGCPKNTFLGLCEEGLVKGIPKGDYTKSVKNKNYALKAVSILKNNQEKSFSPKELWMKLNLSDKRHNSQMDVVLALWENDLIK